MNREIQSAVADALRGSAGTWHTSAEVAESLGLDKSRVHQALVRLCKKGVMTMSKTAHCGLFQWIPAEERSEPKHTPLVWTGPILTVWRNV